MKELESAAKGGRVGRRSRQILSVHVWLSHTFLARNLSLDPTSPFNQNKWLARLDFITNGDNVPVENNRPIALLYW